MNYKLLFPTYRSRYLYVEQKLAQLSAQQKFAKALNLGCGEGDYDPLILKYVDHLSSCDINAADIAFAQEINKDFPNLTYQVEDACQLTIPDQSIDILISTEVIEHVGDSAQMMAEIARVLKPEGLAIISFPSIDFPFTYDPINRILSFFNKKIPLGAYAFGHDRLIDSKEIKAWAKKLDLELIEEQNLGNYIVGLTEMYWVGIFQKILKPNAANLSTNSSPKIGGIRPSHKKPQLTILTDVLIRLDNFLFKNGKASVCKGMIFKKMK